MLTTNFSEIFGIIIPIIMVILLITLLATLRLRVVLGLLIIGCPRRTPGFSPQS